MAFITIIISVSAYETFFGGFVVCIIYCIILFAIAQYLDKPKLSIQDEMTPDNTTLVGISRQRQPSTTVGLLYGLGILALATSGLLFTIALLPYSCDYNDDGFDACETIWVQKQAIANIFTSVLPLIASSVIMWRRRYIPACGFTTYLGVGMFGVALNVAISPALASTSRFVEWWFAITSIVWVLALSYFYIVSSSSSSFLSKAPCSWGINIGGLTYFWSMFAVVSLEDDGFVNWVLLNVLAFVPLMFVGVVTDHNFLVLLGSFGILIDTWRVSSGLNTVFQFVLYAVVGLGVMVMGSWLKDSQEKIRGPITRRIRGQSIIANNEESYNNVDTEEGIDGFYAEMVSDSNNSLETNIFFSDSQEVLSWIGAILVNMAFITIISVSAYETFFGGFVACIIYTILLFVSAMYLEKKLFDNETPSLIGLLYGLGILALATSGLLFTIALLPYSCDYNDDGFDACETIWVQKQAIANIFTSVLPLIASSVIMWRRRYIPACGFTTYLGVGMFGVALNVAISPALASTSRFVEWWFAITSIVWVLALSYFYIVSSSSSSFLSKAPCSWGINIGGLTYFWSMFAVVSLEDDGFVNWVLLNVLAFVPLMFVGVVTDHNFLVLLGSFGILIDTWRVSSGLNTVFQFVLYAVVGLGVMVMGSWLKDSQEKIRGPITRRIRGQSIIANNDSVGV